MRILCVTNDFPPRAGGIQAFVHELLLRQPSGSVVVYAPAWKGAAEFDSKQLFEVVRHPGSLMLPEPRVSRRAIEIAKTHGCDRVMFGAAAPLGWLAPSLREQAGVHRAVGLTHGHETGWAQTPGTKQMLRMIADRLDTLTYIGAYTRRKIVKALSPEAAKNMRLLSPGVAAETFTPLAKEAGAQLRERYGLADRRVVVCVSRLMPRKGQDSLIKVLPEVRKQVPEAALLIVGGGPYRKKLHQLVSATGQESHVVITGGVAWEELPAHYGAGDVFAMPCRTRQGGWDVEGLGIVYLEASATGLPVIAGDSGGAPEAVRPGETGFVVPGRYPAALASRLVQLLRDEELAARLGAAGRAWVERSWNWQHSADRLRMLLAGDDPDQQEVIREP
ncbi:MAG: glycosyltransferase family 4 protein [Candidatus Nanopelagicales bacterium]